MRQFFRLLSLTAAIFSVFAYPALAQQQPAPAARPAATEDFKLTGFRSANFGMTADQVRQAIRRDFPAAADKIETTENAVERTTVLSIQVNDLLPNTGTGVVAYVIGYRTKQLVQVTVTWGGGINPNFKPEQALGAARQLQGYFAGLGYKADTVVTNAQQRDGSIIVFAGDDTQRRRTLLVLANVTGQDGKPPEGAPVLQLSYIRDPQTPDVFQIRRGDFLTERPMHKRTFKKGQPIFKEGDRGLEAFLIESGKVLILKKGAAAPVIVAALPHGSLFGEMAILDGSPRMATAVAGEDTVCVVINSMQLQQKLMTLPPDILRILTALMEYVRAVVPFDQRTKVGQGPEPTQRDQQARMMLPSPQVVEGFGITDPMMKALVRMLCDYTRRRLPPELLKA